MVASDRNNGTCPRPSCGFGMIIDDLVALWSNRHCIKMDNEAALVTTMVFTFLIFVLSTSILLGTQVLTIRSLFLHNLVHPDVRRPVGPVRPVRPGIDQVN